jgi:sugar (pentulose or hexulose) kinase
VLTILSYRISAIKEACEDLVDSFASQYAQPLEVNSIRSVAVSGHQHGLVLLDENDEIVRPCMM